MLERQKRRRTRSYREVVGGGAGKTAGQIIELGTERLVKYPGRVGKSFCLAEASGRVFVDTSSIAGGAESFQLTCVEAVQTANLVCLCLARLPFIYPSWAHLVSLRDKVKQFPLPAIHF